MFYYDDIILYAAGLAEEQTVISINVSDTVTVSENVSCLVNDLQVSVVDTVSVVDAVGSHVEINVSAVDSISVVDAPNTSVWSDTLLISVFDVATILDIPAIYSPSGDIDITVFDTVSASDHNLVSIWSIVHGALFCAVETVGIEVDCEEAGIEVLSIAQGMYISTEEKSCDILTEPLGMSIIAEAA